MECFTDFSLDGFNICEPARESWAEIAGRWHNCQQRNFIVPAKSVSDTLYPSDFGELLDDYIFMLKN